MDYKKTIQVDSFLEFRNKEKNQTFDVKVCVNQLGFRPIVSGFTVSVDIARSDYIFTFSNDLVRPYIGGYVQMGLNFLTNVKFDGCRLCFSVGSIDVKLE